MLREGLLRALESSAQMPMYPIFGFSLAGRSEEAEALLVLLVETRREAAVLPRTDRGSRPCGVGDEDGECGETVFDCAVDMGESAPF